MSNIETLHEIEFKYVVKDITAQDFLIKLMNIIEVEDIFSFSGTDIFYAFPESRKKFARYREDSNNNKAEFTIKEKIQASNSVVRKEVDLPLIIFKETKEDIRNRINNIAIMLGLERNVSIFKEGYVVKGNYVTYCYYTVNHGTTFIEVEARKDKNLTLIDARECIELAEAQILSRFGLGAQDRSPLSLYELYREDKYEKLTIPRDPSIICLP